MNEYHIPVLGDVITNYLLSNIDGIYIDATLGGGGHSEKILAQLSHRGTLIGIDTDDDAIQFATTRLSVFQNKILVRENFCNITELLEKLNITSAQGFLFDLGVSSHQIDDASRGFTYRSDTTLDLRMNRNQLLSGYDVINEYEEKELADIFYYLGGERFSRRIARRIIEARTAHPIATTGELSEIVRKSVGGKFLNKSLARVFQAVRIVVNDELTNLEIGLKSAIRYLAVGGRIVVMSYHSGEDKFVKEFFKECAGGEKPLLRLVTKKPLQANDEETEKNPRSRSVKVRVAEKI